MPSIDFDELRRRIAISKVLDLLRFEPTERRRYRLRGACPIHESPTRRNRQFSVDLAKNCFRCFYCGACGNQLDLWVLTQNLPLHPAAIDLCRRLGIEPPWQP